MNTLLTVLGVYLLIGIILSFTILHTIRKTVSIDKEEGRRLFFYVTFGWLYLLIDFYIK